MRSRFIAIALLFALSACSDGEPITPPPFTPSTAASSPTASVTTHAETAEEFIRRWVETDTKMQNTGDTTEYLAITEPKCSACTGLADEIKSIYSHGGTVRTRGFEVLSIETHAFKDLLSAQVAVQSAPTEVIRKLGEEPEHLSGGNFTYKLTLSRRGNVWRIRSISQVAQ